MGAAEARAAKAVKTAKATGQRITPVWRDAANSQFTLMLPATVKRLALVAVVAVVLAVRTAVLFGPRLAVRIIRWLLGLGKQQPVRSFLPTRDQWTFYGNCVLAAQVAVDCDCGGPLGALRALLTPFACTSMKFSNKYNVAGDVRGPVPPCSRPHGGTCLVLVAVCQ